MCGRLSSLPQSHISQDIGRLDRALPYIQLQWDQRGVGKNAVTADREALKPTLTTERIIADAEGLTAWLRTTAKNIRTNV